MTPFRFSTKGGTLENLARVLSKIKILPLLRFRAGEFASDPAAVVKAIRGKFPSGLLAVRSSAVGEDGVVQSNAGRYKSLLNVPSDSTSSLGKAVREVIASYDAPSAADEVLIQPMLKSIVLSGVVLTADADTLAPYYAVNYDESGKSDAVTGGRGRGLKTLVLFKDAPSGSVPAPFAGLVEACRELEDVCGSPYLDIEFAVDGKGELYLFQCRPIVTAKKENLHDLHLADSLLKIHKKIQKLSAPHPNLLGEKALYGVMPDWNPAEIIGLKPKQLALTLYKELVTDAIWAYQRDNYGYRNLRSHPLMVAFLGVPYIDVRVDFNSFVPKGLNETTARKLVDYYLNKLDTSPHHHDKVEFEIVHSCYYLNLRGRLKGLLENGFRKEEIGEIERALLDLTNNVIDPERGLYQQDLKKIELLREKRRAIIDSHLSIVDKIYWLIEDCKRLGTLPFAGIARAAFIGVQFLKSFVDLKVMTQSEYDGFMNSIQTVAKKLNNALCDLSEGKLSREAFLRDYGHLRPNTYDILSPRYDEAFERYFPAIKNERCSAPPFAFSQGQLKTIDSLLAKNGLKCGAGNLIAFIKGAIEGREYSKYIFTKSLSDVLRMIEELGARNVISREEMAHVDIRTIQNLYSNLDQRDVKDILLADVAKNRETHRYTRAVKLPSLIRRAGDVYGFAVEEGEPNYITLKRISAEVVAEEQIADSSVEAKIVVVRSADPGYDFLFSRNIAGLVTQFGGANSHMAIRCAEYGIPAVIGSGEKNFAEWSRANVLEIDCANKQTRVIS